MLTLPGGGPGSQVAGQRGQRGRRAFTLVEILVVIAILGILASLIYAVYPRVKERARSAACVSNLKQIGEALHMYAQDNDGFIPPYNNRLVRNDDGTITPATRPLCRPDLLVECFYPYTASRQIWFCPSDQYRGKDVLRWEINHKLASYTVVEWISQFAPVSLSAPVLGSASEDIYADDANLMWRRHGQWVDEPFGGNHNGIGNRLMFDGSVQQMNWKAYYEQIDRGAQP